VQDNYGLEVCKNLLDSFCEKYNFITILLEQEEMILNVLPEEESILHILKWVNGEVTLIGRNVTLFHGKILSEM